MEHEQLPQSTGDKVERDKINTQINTGKNYFENVIINIKPNKILLALLVGFVVWFFCFDNKSDTTNAIVSPFFKANDENFKILILPFQQICTQDGKSYDAGFVVSDRLNTIINKEQLKITVHYWSDYDFKGFNDKTAEAIRADKNADMLLFGAYQTDACSGGAEQVCINYITDSKWKLDELGTDLNRNYQKGGINELKTGKIQEKVENLAVFISIIAQFKGIEHDKYVAKLQQLLSDSEPSPTLKVDIFREIASSLHYEGKFKESIEQYKKYLQLSKDFTDTISNNVSKKLGFILSHLHIGEAYAAIGNLDTSKFFLNKSIELSRELCGKFPNDSVAQYCLYATHLGAGMAQRNLDTALFFIQKSIEICNKLCINFPDNELFKYGLAVSFMSISSTYQNLKNVKNAEYYFQKYIETLEELFTNYPNNSKYKHDLAKAYFSIGYSHKNIDKNKAVNYLKKSKKLFLELLEANPNNKEFRNSFEVLEFILTGKDKSSPLQTTIVLLLAFSYLLMIGLWRIARCKKEKLPHMIKVVYLYFFFLIFMTLYFAYTYYRHASIPL